MYLKCFKTLAVFLFVCQSFSFAQDWESIKITATFTQTPLPAFFSSLEKNYPVKFYFKNEWFATDSINIILDQTPLTTVLERISNTFPYNYQLIQGNMVVFLPKQQVTQLLGETQISGNGTDLNQIIVGDPAETGKFRNVVLKGKIINGKTGEPVIGALYQIENTANGGQSDVSGNYSFSLVPGLYTINVSSMGFEKSVYKVKVISNGELNLELFDKAVQIDQVTIYAERRDINVSKNQMSIVKLSAKEIKQLPSLSGEKDIIKSFTMLPGVKSVGEFGSGINVRGGGEDQNLFLIEGTPIYNTAHVLGLLSVINPDAVTDVTLYKGQIPARFGERVSSVMDIHVMGTRPEKTTVKGGIGIYDSRLLVEVPIGKNLDFKIGGRSSYSNWIMQRMPDVNLSASSAKFYDLNASLNWNFGNNHITFFAYQSNDEFKYSNDQAYRYGNKLASVNWGHFYNKHLSSDATFAYSQYDAYKENLKDEYEKSKFSNQIQYLSGKFNLKYNGMANHTFDAGIQTIRHSILPGKLQPLDELSLISDSLLSKEQAWENGIYLNDAWEINNKWALNLGLRFSAFFNIGPSSYLDYDKTMPISENSVVGTTQYGKSEISQAYMGLEPRLSMKYQYNSQNSVKLSYNRNYQYMSLISFTSITVPTDIWKLADPHIKPVISDQLALGYYHNNKNNTIEISTEVYYKLQSNLLEYRNNAIIEMNPHLEQELLNTDGYNYGIEFMIKKKEGKTDGWLSYTYSRSLRQTTAVSDEKINNGNVYPSAYDKPHSITFFGTYHINKRWRIAANFSYSTGRPVTLPEYVYQDGKNELIYWSDRNKYRTPDYHRLDLSVSMDESLRISKRWKGSWTFSVLNVYGRHNTYSVFYEKTIPSAANNYQSYTLNKLYIIGQPLPTLTYNFIF
jgi:hypothetical protein